MQEQDKFARLIGIQISWKGSFSEKELNKIEAALTEKYGQPSQYSDYTDFKDEIWFYPDYSSKGFKLRNWALESRQRYFECGVAVVLHYMYSSNANGFEVALCYFAPPPLYHKLTASFEEYRQGLKKTDEERKEKEFKERI